MSVKKIRHAEYLKREAKRAFNRKTDKRFKEAMNSDNYPESLVQFFRKYYNRNIIIVD